MTVRHVLIPTDGSKIASAALERAVAFAAELKAQVTFLVVTEPFHMLSLEVDQLEHARKDFERYERRRADRVLEHAMDIAHRAGVTGSVSQVEAAHPYEAIIEEARRRGADLIAMGSHGSGGLKAVVLGSVTQKVLTHCEIPVLVFREPETAG